MQEDYAGRRWPDSIEQATAAPGERRNVIPPFPTVDNVDFTDEELIEIGRRFVEWVRANGE